MSPVLLPLLEAALYSHSHALRRQGELLLKLDEIVGHILLGGRGQAGIVMRARELQAAGFAATADFGDGAASDTGRAPRSDTSLHMQASELATRLFETLQPTS